MNTQCLSVIILSALLLIACQATETQIPKTSQTPQTGEETEYIVKEHDFGNYKKFDLDTSLNELKAIQENKKPKTKEDSIKAYIKELTHHFHLQEKQMKALEYIYEKYDKKETQAKAQNDTTKLNKLLGEKEQSIKVVLGGNYYAKKESFDVRYKNKMPTPEEVERLPVYYRKLFEELALNAKQLTELQKISTSFNKSIAKNRNNLTKTKAIKEQHELDIKNTLGEELYEKKQAFDKKYFNK